MDNVTFIRTLRDTAETYNKAADLLEGIDPRSRKRPTSTNGAGGTPRRRVMSAAARKRIADAQRARWAKWKAKQKRAA